jgi:hypothetical protein
MIDVLPNNVYLYENSSLLTGIKIKILFLVILKMEKLN